MKKQNLRYIAGMKKTLDYLYNGEPMTVAPLLFLQGNYKQWREMFNWLVANEIRGMKLVEFFQNESPDGGGYHMGATLILSRLKGHKHLQVTIKADELGGGF